MDNKKYQYSDPVDWVDSFGDYLYNYALFRTNDKSVSEDLVQDTFLSALKNLDSFNKKSSLKTWLTSILKNKIIDYYRKFLKKETSAKDVELYNETEEIFYVTGHWKDYWDIDKDPLIWDSTPEKIVENKQFWEIFQSCLNDLPDQFRAVFVLREMEDENTSVICKELSLSSSNIWVILHRSRKQLRRCLEINWFGGKVYPRSKK